MQVNHLETAKRGGKKLDRISELLPLFYKTGTDVSFLELEGDPQMTPDSVLEYSLVSPRTWSGGSTTTTGTSNGGSAINSKPFSLVCTATTEFVKKKKRSCVLMPRVSCRNRCSQAAAAESISRRKGVPQRSPLNWMWKEKNTMMPFGSLVCCLFQGGYWFVGEVWRTWNINLLPPIL